MSGAIEGLRRAFLGRYPLIYLVVWEEDRALRLLGSFAARVVKGRELAIVTWSCVSGWSDQPDEHSVAPVDPVAAIQRVAAAAEPGIWVLRDLPPFFDRPEVVRALREAYRSLADRERYLVLTSPTLELPEALSREVFVVDAGPPDDGELVRLIEGFQRSYQASGEALGDATEMAFALRGLSLNEATHTLHRVFRTRGLGREGALAEIFEDKRAVVRKAGYLEYVPRQGDMDQIGGLDNLKEWLLRRRKLFRREAIEQGMPIPKGMLVMGMSGCGKSLAAKAAAALWDTALFRLDMNLVHSGLFGTPEAAFDRAIRTVEQLAPAVLWIDEIENSLGLDGSQSQGSPRLFSSFLTWMQEKPPLIFVAATANRISALPAEVIRKGRFDQVFFVDLPGERERREILAIHLLRHGADPAKFDIDLLAIATRGWNGAEIEQAIAAARIDALDQERALEMSDITRNTRSTIPLSKTMHEQMKQIRAWAFGRATLASKERYTETESVALG